MMNKYEIPIPLPKDGVNYLPDSLISDTEAAEGTKNFYFKDGIPQVRPGYKKASPFNFATSPNTLVHFKKTQDEIQELVAVGNVLKKKISDIEYQDIAGELDTDKISTIEFSFKFTDPDVFGNKLIIMDGKNYRYYNGGSSLINITPYVPNADEISAYGTNTLLDVPDEIKKQTFILNDNERIWVAGYDNLVRISDFQRPDYFPSTHAFKLKERCTGMAKHMDEVMLFTENTTTLISGKTPSFALPEKYEVINLPTGYGCSQARSIATGSNAIYWANKNGIYRYRYLPSGFSIPENISEFEIEYGNGMKRTRSVRKVLKTVTDWNKVFANFHNEEYRIHLGDGKVLVFDTLRSTWAYWEYDKGFNCSEVWNNKLLYVGPYLYHMDYPYDPNSDNYDGLNDDGNPIKLRIKGKYFDFKKAANKKKFKELYITLYSDDISYNVTLNINVDNDLQTYANSIVNKFSRMGELAFGDPIITKGTNLNYRIKIRHKGKGYNIQYELVTEELNNWFSLLSIVLKTKIKEL